MSEKEGYLKGDIYHMKVQDFIKEHKRLVKVLKKKDEDELNEELEEQSSELKEILKQYNKNK